MNRRSPIIMTVACISMLLLSLTTPVSARVASQPTKSNFAFVFDDPEGKFEAARVVYNVTVGGEKGMRVHAKIKVTDGLDDPCLLIAYFYNPDGSPVEANSKNYSSS